MHLAVVPSIVGFVVALLLFFLDGKLFFAFLIGLIWLGSFLVLQYADRSSDPASRTRILNWIKRDDNAWLYSAMVDKVVAGLARMMQPKTETEDPKPTKLVDKFFWYLEPKSKDDADRARLEKLNFGWPIYDTALKLAVIYPLVMLLGQWALTGSAEIAGFQVIESGVVPPIRYATIGLIAATLIVRMIASASQQRVFEKVADWLYWIAIAFAVAVAVTAAGAAAFAAAIAAAVAVAVAAAGAFAAAAAGAGAVAAAAAGADAGAIAIAVAVATAAVGAVGHRVSVRKATPAYVIFSAGLAIVAVGGIATGVANGANVDRLTISFAIGLLPLTNAVVDFLSYGTTLTLVRAGRDKGRLWSILLGCVDACIAVALLYLVAMLVCLSVWLINTLAGTEFLNLSSIFNDLRSADTRGQYAWLYLTLLSTLVPTVFHLFIAFLSFFTWFPGSWKIVLTEMIESPETGDLGTLAATLLGATVFTLFCCVQGAFAYGVFRFFSGYFEPFAMFLLDAVEGTFRVLGLL